MVQAGDASGDLDYAGTTALGLNGGTIQDGATNDADLKMGRASGGGRGEDRGLQCDVVVQQHGPGGGRQRRPGLRGDDGVGVERGDDPGRGDERRGLEDGEGVGGGKGGGPGAAVRRCRSATWSRRGTPAATWTTRGRRRWG